MKRQPKNPSLALLTDLYQLTMAYGYWKLGQTNHQAVFHLFFRKPPFRGGYTIAAGLGTVIDYLRGFGFEPDDLDYLATLQGNDGRPLFEPAYLNMLRGVELGCDIDAIPEGTVVFPNQPLLRVAGPILQCQVLETALLNMINFQSLIATKAARVCAAAQGDPVIEFGLRRAQGVDGAMAASRAAYIGGCAATSNVLAGKHLGIPVRGTHAHSWVMAFDTELESFDAYAQAMPHNCVFLVDTYDTLQGVRHAITAGRRLRQRGHEMVGIRLDSGDLAYLSIEARRLLDDAGFPDAQIVASNDLDERIIASLKEQGAAITVWGVGTKLATAYDQPALGGVYKLAAIKPPDGDWQPKLKLSEQTIKISNPGIQQVRRFRDSRGFVGDAIYDTQAGLKEPVQIIDQNDPIRRKTIPAGTPGEDLLVPLMRDGQIVYNAPPIDGLRQRAQDQLASLHHSVKRLENPHAYPAGLDRNLYDHKQRLINEALKVNRVGKQKAQESQEWCGERAPGFCG